MLREGHNDEGEMLREGHNDEGNWRCEGLRRKDINYPHLCRNYLN